jgi:hypothetical protein
MDYDRKEQELSEKYTQSVPDAHSNEEDELNPVGLKKAFRFAAWSSLILVRIDQWLSALIDYTLI